jgi:hypothetical protein
MQKFAIILLLSAAAVACTDESPTPPTKAVDTEKPAKDPSSQLVVLTCEASRSKLTVKCAEPQLGSKKSLDGPVADIIYGGQNTFVTVTSSNVAYNNLTGRFTFDVTLKNLLQQPIGTTDGTTPAPTGVRVFFSSGPTVTGGSGIAAPVPDGVATFTAGGQPFYQYDGILANNATSPAKTWTIIIAPTVDTFTFILFISSPVQFPDGYIEINGQLPVGAYGSLHPGSTAPLTAVVKNALGIVQPGAIVTWGTTDANQASVDPGGVVTGVRYGSPVITATSGGINGSIVVDVTGTTRNWTGAVSTVWALGGNWGGGYTPALVDTANIPTGVPNFPVLTGSEAIGGIIVADLATASLSSFDLTLTALASTGQTAGSGILGSTGTLILSGSSTVNGRFPLVNVTGSYNTTNTVTATAPLNITSGLLQTDLNLIQIDAQ